MMRAGVGFSNKFSVRAAASEAVLAARRSLEPGAPVTAALVFATAAWGPGTADLIRSVDQELGGCPMVGASVAGLFAAGRGAAENPGLAVAVFSGLQIEASGFDDLSAADPESGREVLDHLTVSPSSTNPLLLLADLGQQSPDAMLDGLGGGIPKALMLGLGASPLPQGKALVWCNTNLSSGGIVAAVFMGTVESKWGTSRSSRGASGVHRVSRARDRWISTLDGQPALPRLEEVARASHLPPSTESLRQLLVEVIPEGTSLNGSTSRSMEVSILHNVVGIDPRRNAILLPEHVEVGSAIRFAVRDAVAARENLEALVDKQIDPGTAFGFYLSGSSLDGAGVTGAERDARTFGTRAPHVAILGVRGSQVIGPAPSAGRRCRVLTDTSLLATFES